MKKIASAVLISAFVSAPAVAGDEGFYVGANVGQASTDTFALATKSATAITLQGGYQFMKNLAAEVQYGNFGSITGSDGVTKVKISGFSVAAVGILPINDQFSGHAKLGIASTTMALPAPTGNVGNTSLTYGIGAQYHVSRELGVRVGYDSYKVGDTAKTSQTGNTTLISAGVTYKF